MVDAVSDWVMSRLCKAAQRAEVPVRDGLTYEEDRSRVMDMLRLSGELGGLGPREPYSGYLRRLLDRLIELERR